MELQLALKISSIGTAVRTAFTYNEPVKVEMDAKGGGTVDMHSPPGDFGIPYFFVRGEIPVKSQAHLYDDWIAVEPGEVVKALSHLA